MNYPNNIEQKLGFDTILESVKKKCLTEPGRLKIDQLKFLTDYQQIVTELSVVDEMREILVLDYNFPLSYFDNLNSIFEKLKIEDAQVDLVEIVALKKFMDVLRAVVRFFEDDKHKKFKELSRLSGETTIHSYVVDQINGIINAKGEIKDNASVELHSIRRSTRTKEAEVTRKINAVYAKVKQSGWLDADLSVTIVNGRLVVPVDSNHKRKVAGMVHDVSSTGKTSYIEPSEVLNMNNEIVELQYQEKQEIIRILFQLCENIRPYTPDLVQAFEFLSLIDHYRAKAKYAIEITAIKPAVNPEARIALLKAKHPILLLGLKKEGRDVVPLNLDLQNQGRIALISGPNAGGKSVALKTVGLLQLMLQYGFLIPVSGSTEMGVFESIFIDMGDEQSLDNDLSTYSSHLMNMKHFLKNCNPKTLILIDEFGTGTEPAIGGAIAESVLEQLNETKTFGVITTHYSNLKHLAASREGLVNAAMMFDNQKLQPLFQLELSQAGSSFAFEIARKIGLPEEVLQRASEKVGKKQVDFDKHLREVLRDKKYWNEKRQKVRQQEKKLDALVDELSEGSDEMKALRKQTIKDAKQEAEQILSSVNKKVESTIRDIRSVQADKEKTKAIRKEFEDFKQEIVAQKASEQEDKILKKIEKLKNRKKKIKAEIQPSQDQIRVEINFEVGSKVKIKHTQTYGEILELKNNKVLLAVGDMRMNVALAKLELIANKEFKKKTPQKKASNTVLFTDTLEKKMHFRAHLDIRGLRVDEGIRMLTTFVDDAIATNTGHLKVLHGMGTGALRQAVRDYLRTIDLVSSYKDEQQEMGGAGITVVKMF